MGLETPGRLPPATRVTDDVMAMLESTKQRSGLDEVPELFGQLAHHPEMLRRILGLGLGRLPDGVLSVRHRELLALRTARRCRSTYEWAHHTRRAAERGLSALDIDLAWDGTGSSDAIDRLLLRVADDLHAQSELDDDVWEALTSALGAAGAIEAVAVVGWFHLISYLGNALGTAVEPGVAPSFGPPGES